MKKYLFFILVIFTLVYHNRSYAYIYKKIDEAQLKSPDEIHTYLVGDTSPSVINSSVTYVALGDSLTAGVGVSEYTQSFPYLVAEHISSQKKAVITLHNEGVPGYKIQNITDDMLRKVIEYNPDIITIMIGVNDVHGNIELEDFKNRYEIILQKLTTQTKAKIYIINIPYIGSPSLILFPYNFYFDWKIKDFNKIIKKLTEKHNVVYVDLYKNTELTYKKNGLHYSSDLFHPSFLGYKDWADIIYAYFN